MIERLSATQAVPFFAHPTQARWNGFAGDMPDGCEYRAAGGVCLAFHHQAWPNVWQAHIAVDPSAWGRVDQVAARILVEFFSEVGAARIVAWAEERNRPIAALCRRLGFVIDGRLDLPIPVLLFGWRP